MCDTFGVTLGQLHVKYLGIPLGTSKLRHNHCSFLIGKVQKKLQVWQWRLLSFAGKLELLRNVIYSYQYYWSTTFQLLVKTILKIERRMAIFLWKGISHSISWNKICKPKAEGGPGLRRISDSLSDQQT